MSGPRKRQVKEMKEFRILVTDVPKWDDRDFEDIKDELEYVMNKHLSNWDYTISIWDVG